MSFFPALLAALAAVTRAQCMACVAGVTTQSDETAQLQLERRRSTTLGNQSKLHSRDQLTVLDNLLYWQGYGKESLASYFIGFLGQDSVQVAGIKTTAKLGLNFMGTPPAGNFDQSVQSDSAVLGLLPGCFSGASCTAENYDDLLSTMAREGKIHRAFTLCFDDRRGGGKMFLGRPQVPADAMRVPLHPLTDGVHPYAPLAKSAGAVEFFFGNQKVATRSSEEWNQLVQSGSAYLDTGTAGLLLPGSILEEVLRQLRQKIMADEMCASIWGPYLSKLVPNHLTELTVTQAAATCGEKHLEDFVVTLGADVRLNISKFSFFYETQPCSNALRISWSSAAAQSFVFGTAFHWGKTLLYDTSNFEAPSLIVLGPADGCTVSWAEGPAATAQSLPGQMLSAALAPLPMADSLELKGHAAQVLGPDGTMTANLIIGSPPQEVTVQLDTGSQKLIGIHPGCRNLGFCFLVQPEDLTSTAILPGPEYGTVKCQKQLQVLSQLLSNSSCKKTTSKLLCECRSQEECLRQILAASAQMALEPPSEACGARRSNASCDEHAEFQAEASESFTPSLRGGGGLGVDFALRFAETKRMETKGEKQCQLYDLCKASPESSGAAISDDDRLARALAPGAATVPSQSQGGSPYDGRKLSSQELPAESPATATAAGAELERVLGAPPAAEGAEGGLPMANDGAPAETAQPVEPRSLSGDDKLPWQSESASEAKIAEHIGPTAEAAASAPAIWEYASSDGKVADLGTVAPNDAAVAAETAQPVGLEPRSLSGDEKLPWQSASEVPAANIATADVPVEVQRALGAEVETAQPVGLEPRSLSGAEEPPWQSESASEAKIPEHIAASDAVAVASDKAIWGAPSDKAPLMPPAEDVAQTEVAVGAPQYGAQAEVIGSAGAALQPLPSMASEAEMATPGSSTVSVSAANFPDNSALAEPRELPDLNAAASFADAELPSGSDMLREEVVGELASSAVSPRDEVLDMVPVVPTLSPSDISLAPVADFTEGPKEQPVIGEVIPVSSQGA